MRPAWSVLWFTTLIGCAQGLVVALASAVLAGPVLPTGLQRDLLALAFVLGGVALGCSFLHLGRPRRAWRAAAMWRTSWLSREVIAVALFLAATLLGALWLQLFHRWPWWLAGADVAIAGALWLCTGKVYAAIAFIREWAVPLTPLNFALIGLASGHLLGAALLVLAGKRSAALLLARLGLLWTVLAWLSRAAALARLAGLQRAGSLRSATGIATPGLRQVSRGFTADSFNLHEFGMRPSPSLLGRLRRAYMTLGFALPAAALAAVVADPRYTAVLVALVPLQFAALLGERWDFFAQVDHPQNHYYTAAQ